MPGFNPHPPLPNCPIPSTHSHSHTSSCATPAPHLPAATCPPLPLWPNLTHAAWGRIAGIGVSGNTSAGGIQRPAKPSAPSHADSHLAVRTIIRTCVATGMVWMQACAGEGREHRLDRVSLFRQAGLPASHAHTHKHDSRMHAHTHAHAPTCTHACTPTRTLATTAPTLTPARPCDLCSHAWYLVGTTPAPLGSRHAPTGRSFAALASPWAPFGWGMAGGSGSSAGLPTLCRVSHDAVVCCSAMDCCGLAWQDQLEERLTKLYNANTHTMRDGGAKPKVLRGRMRMRMRMCM